MIIFKCLVQVPRHGIKKNGKAIRMNVKSKKRFIGSNDNVLMCEQWLLNRLRIEKLKNHVDCIDFDVNAKFVFFYPKSVFFTKKGTRSSKVADLSNLYELPQDCLQKVGILANDSLICGHDGSGRMPIDGPNSYIEIILTKIVP